MKTNFYTVSYEIKISSKITKNEQKFILIWKCYSGNMLLKENKTAKETQQREFSILSKTCI